MKAKDTSRKKKKEKPTSGVQTDLLELLLVWEWSWGTVSSVPVPAIRCLLSSAIVFARSGVVHLVGA
ncbi:hypothetical protein PVK06_014366 [Gossypium arboreum]|uniref:Uncharacterized protein n=1 Tax=Gossypium arboreum TaxID=29729 RepID=A0ABR0PUM3_GOSAR|nr:hypothetical protein PVK06_014366 [Gossypium arboreum]